MISPALRRLLWSLPATVVGAVFCGLWVLLYFGQNAPAFDGLIGLMAIVHLIAWLFFIAPFAIFVSSESRVYQFPQNIVFGALFGAIAFVIYAILMALLWGTPIRMWDFIGSMPIITGCSVSGVGVATMMGLFRLQQNK